MRRLHEMTYAELEKHAIDVISELKVKAYCAGYDQGELDAEMEVGNAIETSQEKRERIVEQAKKDVEALKSDYDGLYEVNNHHSKFHPYACTADFIVNKDKRSVVALLRGKHSSKVRAKGIAKCAPNDCFNAHIGKAIALRRALGLDVPDEYLNAPQPTEVRVGDIVRFPTGCAPNTLYEVISLTDYWNLRIVKSMYSDNHVEMTAHAVDFNDTRIMIIDDSREGGR